jgi:GalNAc-alpha-(1->4)-GalNAc-alpha-(1->3)-diNAcBac-PP-undecaprenol alpha-1,4-N-acetyl-D-galactosaminyltransferase
MRLTLVIFSLGGGGAERVLCRLANCWAGRGHQVTLLTLSAEAPLYYLAPCVEHVALGVDSNSSNFFQALRANTTKLGVLRRAIAASRPDLVVSFMDTTNILTLLATLGMHLPIVVSERIDPFHNHELGRIWRALRRISYPRAAKVVVQTQTVLARMKLQLRKTVTLIPNPVVDPGVRHGGNDVSPAPRKWIMAMGRLTGQKGFDLLLEAFAQLAAKYPDWSLRILGDGPLSAALLRQIAASGLEGRAFLLRRTASPNSFLVNSDLFVMSSRFEGFPNALCEAMACGLPVISFDCPSGPAEIIRNGLDGILLPKGDASALAAAMDSLMGDPGKRRRLSKHAPEVIQRFGLERVLDDWEQVFSQACERFQWTR